MLSLFQDYNLMPFHFSLVLLILLGMIQTFLYYFRIQSKHSFQQFLPEKMIHSSLLNIKFSKLLFLVFLFMNFSFSGYFLQFFFFAQYNSFISVYYLIIPAITIALFFTVFMIQCLDQVIQPKQDRNQMNLLGRLATVSQGTAKPGYPTQARVRDEFGQLHYVQVEPEFGELLTHSRVILIRQKKSHYIAKKISMSSQIIS